MDLAKLLGAGGALGAIVTGLTNFLRWWRDRSLSDKLKDQIAQTTQFVTFVRDAPRIARAASDEALCDEITVKVQRALQRTLRNMNETLARIEAISVPDREMSFYRRWFLLFRPRGVRAGLAHFFFYSSASALLLFVWSVSTLDKDDLSLMGYPDKLQAIKQTMPIFVILLGVPLIMRYWAIIENRWSTGVHENPSRLARVFLWYTPATKGGMVARMALLMSALNWAVYEYLMRTSLTLNSFTASFVCSMPSAPFVGSIPVGILMETLAVLVCYFWARAEFRLSSTESPRPPFPRNLRFLYTPRTVEGWAAHLALYSYVFWSAYEIYMLRHTVDFIKTYVSQTVAANPDIDAPSLYEGFFLGILVPLAIANALPAYAAYRWALAEFRIRIGNQSDVSHSCAPTAERQQPAPL